jgi:hypothetical protein
MTHVTLPRMRELSPAPTLVAKINGSYFPNIPRIRSTEIYSKAPKLICTIFSNLIVQSCVSGTVSVSFALCLVPFAVFETDKT